MTTGERLAFYRKRSAMTQQQLGEQLNVSAQAISKWENDQSEPDIATLCKLAEIYQISVNELVGAPAPQTQENDPAAAPVIVLEWKKPNPIITFLEKRLNLAATFLKKVSNSSVTFLKKHWKPVSISVALIVSVITFVLLWNAFEPERMLRNFNKTFVGMTMDEVRDVMGEQDVESEFWLGYNDAKYDEWQEYNQEYHNKREEAREAGAADQLLYEFDDSFVRISFWFDEDGKLIKGDYCTQISEADGSSWGGYRTRYENATIESVEFVGSAPYIKANGAISNKTLNMRICFENDDVYFGPVALKGTGSSLEKWPESVRLEYSIRGETGEVFVEWEK